MPGDRGALDAWESRSVKGGREGSLRADTAIPAVVSTSIKPFCGARQTLAATSALLELVASSSLGLNDIVRIRVAVPPLHFQMVNRTEIVSRLDAISSMQYQVALALLHPMELYDLERVPMNDGPMTELMSRVEVRPEPNLLEHFPQHWSALVEIDTVGETLTLRAEGARDESNLSWENLTAKGERLFERAGIEEEQLTTLRDLVRSFRELGDLEKLASLVCYDQKSLPKSDHLT
jgi:2-methylcitrate dehydratase PrpD